MKIKLSATCRNSVRDRIATHIGVGKVEMGRDEERGNLELCDPERTFMLLPSLTDIVINHNFCFHCFTVTDSFELFTVLNPSKFSKTELYQAFHDGEYHCDNQYDGEYKYVMCLQLKSNILMTYRYSGYSGAGAIIVDPSPDEKTVVFAPIVNWLSNHVIKEEE